MIIFFIWNFLQLSSVSVIISLFVKTGYQLECSFSFLTGEFKGQI